MALKDLTTGRPETVLWKFSLPLFGSVVFQQLYNIADSLIAGKCIGENALAAVGNSYEVTLIYLAIAFGFNIGCSVLVAQLFGAKDLKKVKTAVSTTFLFCGAVCLTLMLLGFLLAPSLLRLINTPQKAMSDTLLYLNIYTGGLLFLFFYNIATGIFSALGDSKTPFFLLAASSLGNIAMDYWFVEGFGMGVDGVAWATFICQGISCVCACAVLLRRLRVLKTGGKAPRFSKTLLRRMLHIAIPSILQQSFVSVGNIFIQSLINSFGTGVMAGYAASVKLNNFAVTSFSTLGNGLSNFTAQNIGAKKTSRVARGFRGSIILSFAIGCVFISAYWFFGDRLIGLFLTSPSADAMNSGVEFLKIISPFYLFVATKLACDGVLRGAGAMNKFVIATFTDLILRVVLAFVLAPWLGTTGIWLSWPVGWIIATALSGGFYISGGWKRQSV